MVQFLVKSGYNDGNGTWSLQQMVSIYNYVMYSLFYTYRLVVINDFLFIYLRKIPTCNILGITFIFFIFTQQQQHLYYLMDKDCSSNLSGPFWPFR